MLSFYITSAPLLSSWQNQPVCLVDRWRRGDGCIVGLQTLARLPTRPLCRRNSRINQTSTKRASWPGAGLTSEDEGVPFLLEASQGDRISGKISRAEVASVAVAALGTAASVGAGPYPLSCFASHSCCHDGMIIQVPLAKCTHALVRAHQQTWIAA